MSCFRWLTFFCDAKDGEETKPLLSKSVKEVPKNPRATRVEILQRLCSELQWVIGNIKAEKKEDFKFTKEFEEKLRQVISQEKKLYPIHLKCPTPCEHRVSKSGDYKEKNGLLLAEKLKNKLDFFERNISELKKPCVKSHLPHP